MSKPTPASRFAAPGPRGRRGAAALAGRRAISCCWATNVAGCTTSQVAGDGSAGLGVLRNRTGSRPRLTDDDKLLVLAQAAVGSYLRYGAYPYAIAVREYAGEPATASSSTASSGSSRSPP